MRTCLLTLAALLAAPLVAPAQAPPGTGFITLRGVLIDAASGQPVRRARAEASTGPQIDVDPGLPLVVGRLGAVMSDDEGRFSLDVPAGATASLRIVKAGYATALRTVPASELRDSVPQLIALERGASIVGRAVTLSGEPVPVVSLLVMRVRESGSPVSTLRAVAPDERGEFRVGGLAPGRYTIDNAVGPATNGLRADRVEVQLDAGREVPVVLLFQPTPGDSKGPTGYVFDAKAGTVTTITMPRPSPPPGGGRMRGVVTSAAGAPLGGAAVAASAGGRRHNAMTDALGQFTLEGLLPGAYTVEATRRGFVRGEHGQRGLDLPGVKVEVDAGADVEELTIVLSPAGAVSGLVHDESGEPLQDATVQVIRVRRGAAGLTPVRAPTVATVRTDDRGGFRVGSLFPGDYVVAASFSAHLLDAGVRTAYATTFWPVGSDLAGASPLDVRGGEEISGLTVSLPRVPVVRLRGSVVTSAGDAAAGTVRLQLARGAGASTDTRTVPLGPHGEFSFDDVTEGEYVIQAQVPGGPRAAESGRRVVTVSRADQDALLIRTSPGSTLSGRIALEGGRPGELMWGYAATAVADGVSWAPATVSNLGSPVADGEPFALSPLAGLTRIRVTSDDENWYLKSIIIDGFDAADNLFDFGFDGRAYADEQVVFSRLGASLTGRATDERARPVRDYAVYVFATERDRWTPGSRWVRLARAAADGTFRIPSLPPGSYWAIAVDRVDAAAGTTDPGDPSLLDMLTPQAVPIVVGEAETRDLTLRVVRR